MKTKYILASFGDPKDAALTQICLQADYTMDVLMQITSGQTNYLVWKLQCTHGMRITKADIFFGNLLAQGNTLMELHDKACKKLKGGMYTPNSNCTFF